jgi:hypothetical protein
LARPVRCIHDAGDVYEEREGEVEGEESSDDKAAAGPKDVMEIDSDPSASANEQGHWHAGRGFRAGLRRNGPTRAAFKRPSPHRHQGLRGAA